MPQAAQLIRMELQNRPALICRDEDRLIGLFRVVPGVDSQGKTPN